MIPIRRRVASDRERTLAAAGCEHACYDAPEMPSEAALLDAWRNGDPEAAAQLFELYFDALHRFFRNKAPEACDDLVQATLLGCFEAKERFQGTSSFRTFVFAVARHKLLTWIGQRRAAALPSDSALISPEASPSEALHSRRSRRHLLEALRSLEADDQILLELFYWERLTGPELGEVLAVPEGTARTRLRRARQRLATELERLRSTVTVLPSTCTDLDDWAISLRLPYRR